MGFLELARSSVETVTADACLTSGSEAVILRAPDPLKKIAGLIGGLAVSGECGMALKGT